MAPLTTRLRVHLEEEEGQPKISAKTFSWPDLRDFMDSFLDALTAMPDGPKPQEVVFETVKEGSVQPVVYVPRAAVRAARTLAKGPDRRWTREQRQRVQPFYDYAQKHRLKVGVGSRKLMPISIPTESQQWTIRELGERTAKVIRAGGRNPRIYLDFGVDGLVACDAPTEIIKSLGKLLYEEVKVGGLIKWDAATNALIHMQITSWDYSTPKQKSKAVLEKLDALLANDTAGFDLKAYVREQRKS